MLYVEHQTDNINVNLNLSTVYFPKNSRPCFFPPQIHKLSSISRTPGNPVLHNYHAGFLYYYEAFRLIFIKYSVCYISSFVVFKVFSSPYNFTVLHCTAEYFPHTINPNSQALPIHLHAYSCSRKVNFDTTAQVKLCGCVNH